MKLQTLLVNRNSVIARPVSSLHRWLHYSVVGN
jgi:hypothetical protein